jgi:lipid-binding SYLF domain-containing protein
MKLRRLFVAAMLAGITFVSSAASGQQVETEIVRNASGVLNQIMSIPARQIPVSLLSQAKAIAIIPTVVKGGFVLGVQHGRGVLLMRDEARGWQPPIFISLTGGSVGWQAGLQATDVILVFKNSRGLASLMQGQLTLGVDASAAAGPVGREATASTDATLTAEILSYSRSRGLFAGVSIAGSVIRPDNTAGLAFYGGPVLSATGESLTPRETLPQAAQQLMQLLTQYSAGPPPVNSAPGTIPETVVPVPVFGMTPALTTPGVADGRPSVETTRQQLRAAWLHLAELVDESWKSYLALPPAIADPSQTLTPESVQASIGRYAALTANPQYAPLVQRPEFIDVQRLLAQLANQLAARGPSPITLPPPPMGSPR